jgi:hypothetical protein
MDTFLALPLLIAAPMLISMGFAGRRAARVTDFKATAHAADGVVTAVSDTGSSVNDNPRVRITVAYRRADGTAAETQTTQVVSRLRIPRPGDSAAVWYDPAGDQAIAQLSPAVRVREDAIADSGLAAELGRLASLRAAGTLTDDEFSRAKQQLLNTTSPTQRMNDAALFTQATCASR